MERNTIRRNCWNEAGKAGIAFGLISTAYMFLVQAIGSSGMNAILSNIITFALWGLKFGGCIWLMMVAMKKFAKDHPGATNSDTFRFGMCTGLLSALIFSAASFANVAFISADMYAAQMEAAIQSYAQLMDSNTLAVAEKWIGRMPQITFFSNLFYCTAYGIVLSAILSRNIPGRDPFADYKPDQQ